MTEMTHSNTTECVEVARRHTQAVGPTSRPLAPPTRHRLAAWGPGLFVWGTWVLMVLGGLAFVTAYGSYVPWMDDWEWVPAVTGNTPVDFSWVWAQLADHRNPLSRLLLLGIYTLAGGNFRAALYANVVFFAVLSSVSLWVVRGLRGRTHYADALFPLVLLNIDQENAFIGLGVSFVPAMVLAGLMLLLIARRETRPTLGTVALAGGCLILLALTGSVGLLPVPALALWVGYLGFLGWRSGLPQGRRNALLTWGLAAVALMIIPLYFIGLRPYKLSPPTGGPGAILRTTLQFLSLTFGPAGSHLLSPDEIPPYVGLGVVALCLVSAWVLFRAWRVRPAERPRVLGLLLFMLAVGCVAGAVGVKRSGADPDSGFTGSAPRYAMLAAPLLCCLYLIWDLYGGERLGRFVPLGLFALLCLLFPLNVRDTLRSAREHQRQMAEVEAAIGAKEPPHVIAAAHGKFLYDQATQAQLTRYLRMLRRAGVGPFRDLPDDEENHNENLLAAGSATPHQMTWADGAGKVQGADSHLLFTLPEPQSVHAVRITYRYEGTSGPASFQMFWRRSVQNDFAAGERHARFDLPTGPGEQTKTVVVNQTIDEFRIHPAGEPCVFKISEIALLVPEEEEPDAYDRMVEPTTEAVRASTPPGATVLVIKQRNTNLPGLPGRNAQPFPQNETGGYLGYDLDNGTEAIDQLKRARDRGAQFLVFPGPTCWYLELFPDFKEYLDTHYRAVHRGDACVIYDLQ